MSDERPADNFPDDAAHKAVRDVMDYVGRGQVTAPARKALSDTLTNADRAPVGRAAADIGLGRAIRR